MANTAGLVREKDQLFRDLFSGKRPKRVPVTNPATLEFAIQYAGMNLIEAQWETEKLEIAFTKLCQDFSSDINPVGALRLPSYYHFLGSKAIVMSSSGYLQHPEFEGMLSEDYDHFIASPYDCIVERILPRLYTAFGHGGDQALTMAKAWQIYQDDFRGLGRIRQKMGERTGYATLGMILTEAPFDFLGDFLRGFIGISGDIRRYPQKVLEACNAALPLMVKKGLNPNPGAFAYTMIPLHMAPYLREKDFALFYWPTLKKLVEELRENGQNVLLFVENDWMRYLDYLYELPENTVLRFEYGDPKQVKEKLGSKHIISGFYPSTLFQTGSKEECLRKAQELLDILAPGGRYWWNTDKSVLNLDGERRIAQNLKAVLQYVMEKGVYT